MFDLLTLHFLVAVENDGHLVPARILPQDITWWLCCKNQIPNQRGTPSSHQTATLPRQLITAPQEQ